MKVSKITPIFQLATDRRRREDLPDTFFMKYMKNFFGEETARKVIESFSRMQLPLPETHDEFMEATEGGIVFLNKYGLVLRIESKEIISSIERVDSAWGLNPIAVIDVDEAFLEICPACRVVRDKAVLDDLKKRMLTEGFDFDDDQLENAGEIPLETVDFPKGMPVVIDRLAVKKLSMSIGQVASALEEKARKAQKEFYAPLSTAFEDGWRGAKKMKDFYSLCEKYVADGKLVTGWNTDCDIYAHPSLEDLGGSKTFRASKVAENYMKKDIFDKI